MALLNEKKKRDAVTLAATRTPADIVGAVGAAADWATNKRAPRTLEFSAPNYAAPNPTNAPVMTTAKPPRVLAAAAAPVVAAAAAAPAGASATQARMAPGGQSATLPAPAQPRVQPTPASPASLPTDVGASKQAGGGSASFFQGSNGVRRTIDAQGAVAGADPNLITVNRQSFGNNAQQQPVRRTLIPQTQASPNLASTYGQSVQTMPDDNVVTVRAPQRTLRSADDVSEQYANKEAGEARTRLLSDLDSQRFRLEMIAGNPGRRGRAALEQLGANARERADLVEGGQRIAADAVQGRATRDNQANIEGQQQQGELQRTLIDAGTRTDIATMGDATDRKRIDASLVQQPSLQQDAEGNYVSVTGTKAEQVMGADGKPVRGQRTAADQRNYQQEADDKLFADLLAMQVDEAGQPVPNAVEIAQKQVQALRASQTAKAAPPKVGTEKNGYRFKGGDPASQDSWEKVQ